MTTFAKNFTINVVSAGLSAPAPASAVGFNTLAFQDDFTTTTTIATSQFASSGFKWYWSLNPGLDGSGTSNWSVNTTAMASGSDASASGGILTVLGTGPGSDALISVPGWAANNAGTSTPIPSTGVFGHAYFEAHIQFSPTGDTDGGYGPRGGWPAWWSWTVQALNMYGFSGVIGPMASAGEATEVDFMESYGHVFGGPPIWNSSLHEWFPPGGADTVERSVTSGDQSVNSSWHTYGMRWTTNLLEVFIDGVSKGTAAVGPGTGWPALEAGKLFLILGSGDNWPMQVDWVRVWTA